MSGHPEVKIAASILASERSRLGEQVSEAESAGVSILVAGSAIHETSSSVAESVQKLRRGVR